MVVVSFIAGSGETTVTVFGGPIAVPILIISFVVITAIPMLYLVSRDITALRERGVEWNRKSRLFYYLITILLPAGLMTIVYLFRRRSKIKASASE